MIRWVALVVLCLGTGALATESQTFDTMLTRRSLTSLEGQRGIVTLFLEDTGAYRVPQQCTGPALIAMLQALQPHLQDESSSARVLTVYISPADGLRLAAADIEAREALFGRYRQLLIACERGE